MCRSEAEKQVRDIREDAKYERARGGAQDDADALAEKLIEVLMRPGGYPVR